MAARLTREAGAAHWSLSDLALACGIAKGTIYLYFDSRDSIMQALLSQEISRWLIVATGQVGGGGGIEAIAGDLWQAAQGRPVLMALAGTVRVPLDTGPNEALGHFAAELSIHFGLRQSVAVHISRSIVVALMGSAACAHPAPAQPAGPDPVLAEFSELVAALLFSALNT